MVQRIDDAQSSLRATPERPPIRPCRDATIAALVVCLAFGITVFFVWRSALERQGQHVLAETARAIELAAGLIDADAHDALTLTAEPQSSSLTDLAQRVAWVKRTQSLIESLYTLGLKDGVLVPVLDGEQATHVGARTFPPAAMAALTSGRTTRSLEYATAIGPVVSLYAPIHSKSGAVRGLVGADVKVSALTRVSGAADQVLLYGSLFTGACAFFLALVVYQLRKSIREAVLANEARLAAVEERSSTLVQAQKQSDSVLASMSHEIRTPLTAILGFTELLLEPNNDFGVLRNHALTIRRNSQHLLGVLNDALDISKIDAGMMRVHDRAFDPARLVRDVVDLYQPRANDKSIGLELVEAGAIPPWVVGDELRLRQIVLNLLSNALKFTEEGSVVVTLRYDEQLARLSCSVRDSGIGISPENLVRIFEPYQQSINEDVRSFGGTGLGLTISKRLANLLGGDLTVESTPGEGANFTVFIPAPITTAAESDDLQAYPPQVWLPRPSWRVLVVEDTLEHQKLFYAALRRAGHSVDVCETGERAVNLVREAEYLREPYTVIVLDVHLPGMCGGATARALREHGFRGPILAISADATEETRTVCIESGCNELVTKPVDRRTLLSALVRLVHEAAAAGAA
ncbi:MAG: response regulator [Planctomycetes bacterium]|nr:response regulator [Planctomycetota bacterium]